MKQITKSPAKGRTRKAKLVLSPRESLPTESEQNAGHNKDAAQPGSAGGGDGGQSPTDAQSADAPTPQPIRRKAGSRKAKPSPEPNRNAPTATTNPREGAKKAKRGASPREGSPSSQRSAGHVPGVIHTNFAGGGEDRADVTSSPKAATPDLAAHIATLRELATQRRAAIKLQIKINNGTRALIGRACGFDINLPEKERAAINKRAAAIVKAVEAGQFPDDPVAETLAPFILTAAQARAPFDALRKQVEKDMEKLAEHMPVYSFVEDLKGFGALGLSIIVGEAGDIGQYGNPAKLWKRMGLAVINGKRQGNPGKNASAEDWIKHGYNKERRSLMWQIVDSFMKHQSQWTDKETGEIKKPAGPYGEIYMAKKADYVARIEPSADLPANHPDKWTPMRAEKAARRYVEKRLLRDLWRAWRAAIQRSEPENYMPPAELPKAAE